MELSARTFPELDRTKLVLIILLFALGATAAAAQSGASAGVTAGAAKLSDTRSEQALTGIVQLQPRPWLTLSALPALVHVSDEVSGRPVSCW